MTNAWVKLKKATPPFYAAWYRRTKEWARNYWPSMAQRLHAQARGEAGGKASPIRPSGMEKMALSRLTAENVKALSDEELNSLHRRCHQLAGRV